MSRTMTSGYAYKWTRKQWIDEMVSIPEVEKAKFLGQANIDGNKFALFKIGRSTFAQLWHMTDTVTLRAPAPVSASSSVRSARSRR